MTVTSVLRSGAALLLPARTGMPKKHWRWLWLAMVFRLLIGVPFFLAFCLPYAACKAFIWGTDQLGMYFGRVYVGCFNADLKRSGWREPPRVSPVEVTLSAKWRASAGG